MGLVIGVDVGSQSIKAVFVDEGADVAAAGFEDDFAFCRHLTQAVGVAAIPPSAFYSGAHKAHARHLARFAFCKRTETLLAAGERLRALASK